MQNPNLLAILEKEVGDPMVQEIEITMKGKDKIPCKEHSFRSLVMLMILDYYIKHSVPLSSVEELDALSKQLTEKIKSKLLDKDLEVIEHENCVVQRTYLRERDRGLER